MRRQPAALTTGCAPPDSQLEPLWRYVHQRQLFEMVLWLVLVQDRRLPVEPAADYVIRGQQISQPADASVCAQWSSGRLCCW